MTGVFRALTLVVLIGASAVHAQTPSAGPPAPQTARTPALSLTPEQMEAFLLKARIVSTRDTGVGVTDSRRATLSDGTVTHDAHIQVVNQEMAVFKGGNVTELNFKDSYRFNIAGYRLARLLDMDNVPMSVERRIDSKTAAVTWWVDDVLMDEKERMKRGTAGPDPERTSKQMHVMRAWDELIQNRDRNQGNILWTSDWKLWLIDHTRAFRLGRDLLKPDQLSRIERSYLERLRGLTRERVAQATKGVLTSGEVAAVLARRDALVKHFDTLIAKRSEEAVLFSY